MSYSIPTFVISSITPQDSTLHHSQVLQAYRQAANTVQTQTDIPFDEVYIGRFSDQLIQGVDRRIKTAGYTNNFELTPRRNSQAPHPLTASVAEATEDIRRSNCNTTDRIIQMMLRHRQDNQSEPLPMAIVEPNAVVTRQEDPRTDVFGEKVYHTCQSIAARFIKDEQHGYAQYLAHKPMQQLAKATFRCEYLKTLARYPGHLVAQFELWQD